MIVFSSSLFRVCRERPPASSALQILPDLTNVQFAHHLRETQCRQANPVLHVLVICSIMAR